MATNKPLTTITQSALKERLEYNPETGMFSWRQSAKGVKKSKGMRAGCRRNDGYNIIRIDGTLYLGHRLAWLWMTGAWPEHDVDHINGIRGDDRWSNLRDVPRARNLENQHLGRSKTSKSGMLGVRFYAGRYIAGIQVAGRSKHIGCYDTAEEAHAAYVEAKRRLHAGCTL